MRSYDKLVGHIHAVLGRQGLGPDEIAAFVATHGEQAVTYATERFDYYRSLGLYTFEAQDLVQGDLTRWLEAR